MARRRNNPENHRLSEPVGFVIFLLGVFACVVGFGLIRLFFQLHPFLASAIAGALVVATVLLIRAGLRAESERTRRLSAKVAAWQQMNSTPAPEGHLPQAVMIAHATLSAWTVAEIVERMRVIDWYQFEKLNAAILTHEGWAVERKGGAAPDGGVDLVAVKDGLKILVQCKHWRGWKVQEKIVREMLGSMTHFNVTVGAIHTLKGWTHPAKKFADEHRIDLADEQELARRARASLTDEELARWLLDDTHRCPRCEAEMVLRTGDFKSFWGCPHYPRCRGTLRETVLAVAE